MNELRDKIFDLVSPDSTTRGAAWYNRAMILFIVMSLVPLGFNDDVELFHVTDAVVTVVFVIDYVLRWSTADLLLRKGPSSFGRYPFTPLAILDLISILPSFFPVNDSLRLLRLLRFARALRFVRFMHRSKSLTMFYLVLKREKEPLLWFGGLAAAYILVCAVVVFNVEPQTFDSLFMAVYWACISLSTVGYGDIYPVTELGRFIAMLSSLVGIAVVAFPASILTSGYMQVASELAQEKLAHELVDDGEGETAAQKATAGDKPAE